MDRPIVDEEIAEAIADLHATRFDPICQNMLKLLNYYIEDSNRMNETVEETIHFFRNQGAILTCRALKENIENGLPPR